MTGRPRAVDRPYDPTPASTDEPVQPVSPVYETGSTPDPKEKRLRGETRETKWLVQIGGENGERKVVSPRDFIALHRDCVLKEIDIKVLDKDYRGVDTIA